MKIAKTRLFALLTCVTIFAACFREDEKVILPPPGDTQLGEVAMGNDYKNQTFYSLRNGVILTNEFAAWDLAFESSANGFHVWLNSGKDMKAKFTNNASFVAVQDTAGDAPWQMDASSWNPDSTAIGDWLSTSPSTTLPNENSGLKNDAVNTSSNGYVYILKGNHNGSELLWKIMFEWVNATSYKFKFGKLDNSFTDSIVLDKNQNETYTYFTFDGNGHEIIMEPKPNEWDMLFTRYRHIFHISTSLPYYIVSGVLLNPQNTFAAVDSTKSYADVDYAYAHQVVLSSARNAIGYNWKAFNFDTQLYEVRPNYVFIIRDKEGYYWKLHFLDFYNDQGEKGSPKFEYQRL